MKFKAPLNQNYRGEINESFLLKKYFTKIYFIDIKDRDPATYEWDHCALDKNDLVKGIEKNLENSLNKGIPHFAISFPHATTIYRWGDPRTEKQETNIYRIGWGDTRKLENLSIEDLTIPFQVGCPAEVFVVGQENIFRAQSKTMKEYLEKLISKGTYIGNEILNPNFIREFLIKNSSQ